MAVQSKHTYRSSATLTKLMNITLGLRALAMCGLFAATFYLLKINPNALAFEQPGELLVGIGGVIVLLGLASIVSTICFLFWVNRSCKNAHALSVHQPMLYSSGWSVGWFFVPIANFFMPLNVLYSIWNNSNPNTKHEGTKESNKLANIFWVLWIITAVLDRVSSKAELENSSALLLSTVAVGFELVLIVFWYKLVNQIHTMQEEKYAGLNDALVKCSNCGEPIQDTNEKACQLCGESIVLLQPA